VKRYWETVADNLSKSGWSWGCIATVDSDGRTIFIADAHRDDGKRFVVHAVEKLTAFKELESAIRSVALRLFDADAPNLLSELRDREASIKVLRSHQNEPLQLRLISQSAFWRGPIR
jgi:alpha-D-ribose 1-methylphosphonate 5-triphosphate synthase subunit PhnH